MSQKEHAVYMRYKKVRFFESKKAERKLHQAAVAFTENPSEETFARYAAAKQDTIYVMAFPKGQKYMSLFPSVPCTDAKVLAAIREMKQKLAREQGITEDLVMDDALAMAKVDATKEAPAKVDGETAEAVEGSDLKMTEAFSAKKGGRRQDSDDDDEEEEDEEEEDDDEEDSGDDDEDVDDESDDDGDDDGEDSDDDDDNDDDDEDSEDDDEDDSEDDDDEDDEDSDDDDDDEDLDDEDDEEMSDEEDDDEEEEDDDSEDDAGSSRNRKKARRH